MVDVLCNNGKHVSELAEQTNGKNRYIYNHIWNCNSQSEFTSSQSEITSSQSVISKYESVISRCNSEILRRLSKVSRCQSVI